MVFNAILVQGQARRSVLPQLMASLAQIPLALEYFDVPRNAETAEGRSPLIYVGSH